MIPIRCRACGELRPFERIAVKKTDEGVKLGFGVGVLQTNYQYCDDRPACAEAAAKFAGYVKDTVEGGPS